ncbi:MAG: copper chaperone PCu(A)C [Rhodocyclales bacterium]|nr:copper chaperone PCu(A)C [Rhodocyclales bacterium]
MLLAAPAWAEVKVDSPRVRGTTSTQKATGAFMTIVSSESATLVAAASPLAGKVEIHEMHMDGAVMRMRRVDEIRLPAGKPVDLNPGGYHIMLMALREQLHAGAKVPLTLKIRNGNGAMTEVALMARVTSVDGK